MKRKGYQHALLVTNLLHDDDAAIVEESKSLNDAWPGIELSLVHVITRVPIYCLQLPSIVDIQDKLYSEAKEKLITLGKTLNISTDSQWLLEGSVEKEVLKLAKKIHVDLIITGDNDEESLPNILGGSVVNRLFQKTASTVDLLCMHGH